MKRWGTKGKGILAVLAVLLAAAAIWPQGSNEVNDWFSEQANGIIMDGEMTPYAIKMRNQTAHVPVEFLKDYIDPMIYLDEETASLLITTEDKVIQFKKEELQAFVNETPFKLSAAVFEDETGWYVPSSVIETFYPFTFHRDETSGLSVVRDQRMPTKTAEVRDGKGEVVIRQGAARSEPIVTYATEGETVEVLETAGKWAKVQKGSGEYGYIRANQLTEVTEQEPKPASQEESKRGQPLEGPVNLVWEAVYSQNPNVLDLPTMDGVNVVSPTWFELKNENGDVGSKADAAYVNWAHLNGMEVWALFSNAFEPDRTHEVLASYDKRMHVIKQLLAYAEIYKLDGINIDFEYMHLKDKEALVQFVRELTAYLHQQELVVSMDVTIHSTSDMWSRFYDREKLAETVDYIALMTYDETPAASPIAGSVASLPWVERGLQGVLEEVPAEKLLLGIPLYTRVWTERDGNVTSETLSLKGSAAYIEEHELIPVLDEETGQHYGEYTDEEGVRHRVWFEDEQSIKQRIAFVERYGLAGIASWQRGFAPDDLWEVLHNELEQ